MKRVEIDFKGRTVKETRIMNDRKLAKLRRRITRLEKLYAAARDEALNAELAFDDVKAQLMEAWADYNKMKAMKL